MRQLQLDGYAGRILEADLAHGSFRDLELDSRWIELYVGGGGYATRLLYDLISRETDPLSPDNPLIAMTGPFTGLAAISPKTLFVARSPLTGFLGKSAAGGSFGAALKMAGYDGVVVKGRAGKPTFLSIVDGIPRSYDASSIWGKGVFESCRAIKDTLKDERARIAAIGPAGEKLVKIASVITDERRAFGRTGFGALMGSKLLKAIAVSGEAKIHAADEKRLRELNREYLALAPTTSRGGGLKAYGTGGGVIGGLQSGNLPIKNWTLGNWPNAEKITTQTFMERYRLEAGMKPCGESVACSIQCERRIKMDDPKYGKSFGKGPEYETLAALGSMTLVDNIEAIIRANDLCDDLGVDTISVGSIIAWAMEAYEKGVLRETDIGFPLKWGDGDAVIKLIQMIAFKEGVGALLSEGVKEASRKIGGGSEKFAVHTKGLEVAMHNPRLYHTMGVLFSVSNIGGSHLQGMGMLVERGLLLPEYGIGSVPENVESKIKAAVVHQSLCAFMDSTGQCKFGVFGVIDFERVASMFNAITGRSEDKDSILKIGDRIWYLERLLNIKLGLKPEDDKLPDRFVREPVQEGPAKGAVCPIEALLPEFYKARELDPTTGMPSQETLERLELDV